MKEIVYLDKELKVFFEDAKAARAFCRYIPQKNLTQERFQNLWFANPSEWKDPFEGLFINASYKLNGKKDVEYGLKGRVFCLCLASNRRCEAAWAIYKCDTQFVISKIKLIEYLKSLLPKYDVYIGKVKYRDESFLCTASYRKMIGKNFISTKDESWVKLLFLKRMNYKYEEEIRIVLVDKNSKEKRKGILIPIKKPYSELYTSIILKPNISKRNEQKVRDYLIKKLGFSEEKINKDSLYDDLKKRKSQNMNLDLKKKILKREIKNAY